jgi:two-component system phosphate regulon sensor histidine kinase PhoR
MNKISKQPIVIFSVLLSYILLQSLWWLNNTWNLYKEVYKGEELERKFWMLLGEGSVFIALLFFGFFITYRAFKKEMAVSNQQRNFLMAITHELKTPIASIKLLWQTIASRKLEPEQVKDLAGKGVENADRLNQMVENILLATKIDEQLFILQKEKISLKKIIADVIQRNQNGFLKNHKFSFLHNATDDFMMTGDEMGLSSIIINLLENAAKYSEQGSEICIDLKKDFNTISLTVSDEGEGIPDDEKKNIFQKFYRVGNENTRKNKGTGLGLFIVKNLVELHNGSIEVRDNSPKGAIFTIQFPIQLN